MKRALARGFTLVELLIVIGLLGAIALIVIAAINPIEQANRARDARFKADSAQLISAIDRYFAAQSEFPWMTQTPGTYNSANDAFGFVTAGDENVGICGVTCSDDGNLILNDELKTEFRSRDFADSTETDNQIMIGKETGSSSSVYACFIPRSKSTKEQSCNAGKVYTISVSTGERTPLAEGAAECAADSISWETQYVCVPE